MQYLGAAFAAGKELPGWIPDQTLIVEEPYLFEKDNEENALQLTRRDALLGYVFCLDALFGNLGDPSSKGVRVRAGIVAGITEQEVVSNTKLLKLAQDIRGDLVHRRIPKADIDMLRLRQISQRALAVILSLAAEFTDEDDLKVLLHDLPHSDSSKARIEQARARLYQITP